MTQQNKEKASNVGLIIITFILLAFLAGILGHEPYMKGKEEKQPEQINVQIEGEETNGN